MANLYIAYLKNRELDSAKGQVIDAAFFPSDDPEVAELIAQARFAEQLQNPQYFVDVDFVSPSTLEFVLDDEDD